MFSDDKFVFTVVRCAFLPEFLKNRHVRVTVVIYLFRTARAFDATNVLCEFAVERNGKCEK